MERLCDFCVFVCGGCMIFCVDNLHGFFAQRMRAFHVKRLNNFFCGEVI